MHYFQGSREHRPPPPPGGPQHSNKEFKPADDFEVKDICPLLKNDTKQDEIKKGLGLYNIRLYDYKLALIDTVQILNN